MTSSRWSDLPLRVREVAVHEAAHGVIGEVLGWPVKRLRVYGTDGGVCVLRGKAPAPWVDVVVSAAGHAAEVWYCGGEPSAFGSEADRRGGAGMMERAGVDTLSGVLAVCELEGWLTLVFDHGGVGESVLRVAHALVRSKGRHLDRRAFLRAADLESIDVGAVRRYCRRLAFDVHHQHLEGTT